MYSREIDYVSRATLMVAVAVIVAAVTWAAMEAGGAAAQDNAEHERSFVGAGEYISAYNPESSADSDSYAGLYLVLDVAGDWAFVAEWDESAKTWSADKHWWYMPEHSRIFVWSEGQLSRKKEVLLKED